MKTLIGIITAVLLLGSGTTTASAGSSEALETDLMKLIKQQYPNVDTEEGLDVDGPNVSPRQVAFYIPNAHMACRFTEKPLRIFNCRQVHG
jgi:hypothetical protein